MPKFKKRNTKRPAVYLGDKRKGSIPRPYPKGARIPRKELFYSYFRKLPLDFQPSVTHSLITQEISTEIARSLKRSKVRGTHTINFNLIRSAHLARPMFRHLGGGTTEGIGAVEQKPHTDVTEGFLRMVKAPELRRMIKNWYNTGREGVLRDTRIEDIPFLVGGYMLDGTKEKEGKWKYEVVLPAERHHRLTTKAKARFRGNPEELERRLAFLDREFQGLGAMTEWLHRNGINLREIAQNMNEKIRTGQYEMQTQKILK